MSRSVMRGYVSRVESPLRFESLQSMPCGCITGTYQVRAWRVTLVIIEVKGPHCVFADHHAGQALDADDLSG